MIYVRSLAFNLAFYGLLVTMLIVGLPVLIGGEGSVRAYARLWSRLSLGLLRVFCGTRVEFRGLDQLASDGVIVAAKHQSFLDILVLLAHAPRFVFIMKQELAWLPVMGWYMSRAGMIPINRERGRANLGELTERARTILRGGRQLIIFPEGTRRPPGAEPQYKSGVAFLYGGTGMPCQPVALNTGLFWPRRKFLRYPGTAVIEYRPVIEPGLDKASFLVRLQDSIESASNRLLEEHPAHGNRSASVA